MVAIPLAMGRFSLAIAAGLWLAIWVVAATVVQLRQRLATAPQPTLAASRLASRSRQGRATPIL